MADRIVSLVPAATETLFALGLGDRVQAVSHACDHPPEVASLPEATRLRVDLGGSSAEIDEAVREVQEAGKPLYEVLEAVLHHADPDLVIAQEACSVCGVTPVDVKAALGRIEPGLGPEILALHPHTLEDAIEDVERVARAAGASAAGARLSGALRDRVTRVETAVEGLDTPATLVLDWIDPPMVAGHWIPGMLAGAGGQPLLLTNAAPSRYAEWAEIRDVAPEVLVLAPCGFDVQQARGALGTLEARDGYQSLPAVRDGRVHALPAGATTSRPGPRLVDGLEQLAVALHGDALPGLDPQRAAEVARLA